MKVLHLASWYPNRTGKQDGDFIQRHIRVIAEAVPSYVIHIVKDSSLKKGVEKVVTASGGVTEVVVYYNPRSVGISVVDKLISYRVYQRLFKKEILEYVRVQGMPDLVHVHVAMRAGIGALWLKRRAGVPFLLTEHWSGYYKQDPDNYFKRDTIFRYQTKRIIREAALVTAVSDHLSLRLSAIFGIATPAVIYNSVDTRYFFHNPSPGSVFRFIHVSNMHPIKNVEGIFKVLANLKQIRSDWKLTLVGVVDAKFRQLADTLNISEQIDWVGEIAHEEVPAQLNGAHALLMFSHHENLSCVACEALCCGLPVITSGVGGMPEIVNHSNGILCRAGDEKQLLEILVEMMDQYDRFDRSAIAAGAAEKFREAGIRAQFLALYNSITTSVKP